MSYDISLRNENDHPVRVPLFMAGSVLQAELTKEGTLVPIGTSIAEISVTSNYSQVTKLLNFSFNDLDGKTGEETLLILNRIVDEFGTEPYKDYWAPTPGNVGAMVQVLLEWARLYPAAVWCVT